ncbi:hypothetical protein CEV08_04180 [Bartonella tribocorum]|uniref:Uncharacterized protein n=1 Tax=Bartonella tribocorum TaxID=85701 RepID=A0A2M6UW27_9HYPH|nr:hypothetical protein CEV08_04180 [Bartonella tribocorum]
MVFNGNHCGKRVEYSFAIIYFTTVFSFMRNTSFIILPLYVGFLLWCFKETFLKAAKPMALESVHKSYFYFFFIQILSIHTPHL